VRLSAEHLILKNPYRVARSFEPSDLWYCSADVETYATEWTKSGEKRWERRDEWGNIWARVDQSSKGEVARGILDNLDNMDSYQLPDYSNPADYECVRKARREHPDLWLIGMVPGFAFNIARKLRRLDQYLMDIVLDGERIHELHNRIDALIVSMIRNYAEAGADCIFFCEDWGTQQQLLIDPKLWLKEFFPRFQKLCSIAKECGIRVFMHSCGRMTGIIAYLIDAGIDLFQFDQPELHGLDTLAGFQEKNKITYWCPVDIQKTLQTRSEGLIRSAAREMLDKLWKGRGGFIAGFYSDETSIGLEAKYQQYACGEFVKYGTAENYC